MMLSEEEISHTIHSSTKELNYTTDTLVVYEEANQQPIIRRGKTSPVLVLEEVSMNLRAADQSLANTQKLPLELQYT